MKGKKGLWPFKTQGKTPQPELVLDPDPAGGGLWAFSLTVSNGDYEAQSKTITVRTVNNW